MLRPQLNGYVPASRGRSGGPWLLLAACLLAGIAYAAIRSTIPGRMAAPHPELTVATTIPGQVEAGASEVLASADFRLHSEHLRTRLRKATEKVWKAQDLVRLAAKSADRNFLERQRRQLESADANCELARRELEAALEEVSMQLTHLDPAKEEP